MIGTQTGAIFYDAYRGLRARKMFWIVLGLSGLVAGLFAAVGIDEHGVYIFGGRVTSSINTEVISAAALYKYAYMRFGLHFWLTWIAAILALISTAGIFPALMAGGSIDLLVSKPIGRVRLFLTEYAAGLLFVTLQVLVFSLASFLVIGIRGGAWEPGLFLAVPMVVCFFSYLFAVAVFFGLVTRSTVAAILLTLLFWLLLWGLHFADSQLLMLKLMEEHEAAVLKLQLDDSTAGAERLEERLATDDSPAAGRRRAAMQGDIDRMQTRHDRAMQAAGTLGKAQRVIYWVKTFLPKTAETVDLTERMLVSTADLKTLAVGGERPRGRRNRPGEPQVRDMAAPVKEFVERTRGRSAGWVVGTSLAFECAVLFFAAWIFRRRDF